METRIINIQAATAGRRKIEDREEAFHGNPWAAEWKSGRDSTSPSPSLLLLVRIMIQPSRQESVGGRTTLRICVGPSKPGSLLSTSNGSHRLEENTGRGAPVCSVDMSSDEEFFRLSIEQ
ncbi:hypothetical protein QLX08_009553 [Tetragonisca angustula]|uniref:Uncharacterized protein n=1 Tax=Tetragonisca angustula TaxID=166442 RepID=A0AAW0ZFV1_9HYME